MNAKHRSRLLRRAAWVSAATLFVSGGSGCGGEGEPQGMSTQGTSGQAGQAGQAGAAGANLVGGQAGAAGQPTGDGGAGGASGAAGSSGGAGQAGAAVCIGVKPPAEAWGAAPSGGPQPMTAVCPGGPACVGAPWPTWALRDVQPQSCGFDATYGLAGFEGKPLVVVLLAGWCGYCQGQAVALQKMALELEIEGKQPRFVIVNAESAVANQKDLFERCSFPIFQDTPEVNAWGLHGGGKDDFYLYDSKGKLGAWLQHSGATPTNLSTPEGYAAVKAAIAALP